MQTQMQMRQLRDRRSQQIRRIAQQLHQQESPFGKMSNALFQLIGKRPQSWTDVYKLWWTTLAKIGQRQQSQARARQKSQSNPDFEPECNLIRVMLQNGIDVNKKQDGMAPLVIMIQGRMPLDIIYLAIDHYGALVNIQGDADKLPNTPLMWAIRHKNYELFHFFIDQDADVNLPGEQERTPLIWAIISSDIHFVDHLIKKGANVNTVDVYRGTPLTTAIGVANSEEQSNMPLLSSRRSIIERLIEAGAEVDGSENSKRPLIVAARYEDPYSIRLLIDKKANVLLTDDKFKTALDYLRYKRSARGREARQLLQAQKRRLQQANVTKQVNMMKQNFLSL
jgi:hypothetical protein